MRHDEGGGSEGHKSVDFVINRIVHCNLKGGLIFQTEIVREDWSIDLDY